MCAKISENVRDKKNKLSLNENFCEPESREVGNLAFQVAPATNSSETRYRCAEGPAEHKGVLLAI